QAYFDSTATVKRRGALSLTSLTIRNARTDGGGGGGGGGFAANHPSSTNNPRQVDPTPHTTPPPRPQKQGTCFPNPLFSYISKVRGASS
ncbi:unnamed protein product, partial [Ectocarpus fasciculatus]